MMLRRMLMVGAAATATLTALPAMAQDSGQLEEIVVTAQRRSENLQDVPVAVTAFGQRQLEALQIKETTDLVRYTPSVTGGLNTGTGSALSFYIRGLGSTEQIASFDIPVATYVDEIYIARQTANAISLFDIEQVEVLRGPQGTLFGRNTTGGAVSITTRKPSKTFGYFVEGSYGSFGRGMVRGSVDLPINDVVQVKLSGFDVKDDGYSRSLVTGEKLNGEDSKGFRGALRVTPNDKLTWDAAIDIVDQSKTTLASDPVDPKYRSRTGLRQTDCDGNIIQTYLSQSRGNCSRVQTGGLTSNLTYDFDFASVSFITGYRTTDHDFAIDFFNGTSARGGYAIANQIRNQQFTQEVKLVGETGKFKWVAGGFYLDEQTKTSEIDYFGVLLADWTLNNTTKSLAVYAQTDIALTDALSVTVGGRYTEEDKTLAYADGAKASYPTGVIVALPAAANRPTTANVLARGIPVKQSEERFTPRVAATYKFDDDKLIYVSATNGFKSGGWNTRVTNVLGVTIFGPEKAWSYELGARTDWLDKRLRVNATLYHEDVKDLQLLSGSGTVFSTRNAGDLGATGLELEVNAAVTSQWNIVASASTASRKYKNIPAANGTGGVSCSNTPEPTNCTTTRDDPVRFPELQGTLGSSYKVPIAALKGSLNFNGSVSYSQTYWTSTYNDTGFKTAIPYGGTTTITRPLAKVPVTTLVNVGMVFKSDDTRWEAALECSNCTKEYYATSALFGFGYYNDPRRITARLKYTY